VVENEIAGINREIAKTPMESAERRLAHMMPISWGAECGIFIQ
jgi:hypothetical protein